MTDKEAYQKKLEAQLEEADAKLQELEARRKETEADAQIEYDRRIERLNENIEKTKREIVKLEKSSGEAWDSIKGGVESAWKDLSEAVKDASDKLRNR